MIKKKALLCAVLVLALAVQAALAEGLCRVEQDGKYALADDSGFLLTDYIYDYIENPRLRCHALPCGAGRPRGLHRHPGQRGSACHL